MAPRAPPKALRTCPYCGSAIGEAQSRRIHDTEAAHQGAIRKDLERTLLREFKAEAEERVRKERAAAAAELQRQLKSERTKTAEAQKLAEKAAAKAQKELGRVKLDMAKQVEEETAAATANLRSQYGSEAAKAARAQKLAEKATAKAQGELKSVSETMNEEVESRVEAEKLAVEKELAGAMREQTKRMELANKTIRSLKKQLDSKPAHELGGIQEDELVDLLRGAFPQDKIAVVGKGRAGADVLHEVVHKNESCGVIVYESKNVQAWQNEFIAKLIRNKDDHKATYAVLVSTAFPGDARDFCVVDGVPVVHPNFVLHLVHVLRPALIDVKMNSLSFEETGFKLEQLMIYVNGPEFKNKMSTVFNAVRKLEMAQQKERRAHDRTWIEESTLHRTISVSSAEVQGEIQAILAGT